MSEKEAPPKKKVKVAKKGSSKAAAIKSPADVVSSSSEQQSGSSEETPVVVTAGSTIQPRAGSTTGNHQRYYGYRTSAAPGGPDAGGRNTGKDPRLSLLRREWYEGKKIRDVGCNAGQFTALIAREFKPRYAIGVDADETLVHKARTGHDFAARAQAEATRASGQKARDAHGAGVLELGQLPYPHNLWFELEDAAIEHRTPAAHTLDHGFDVVSAFSVTKWIQLSHGDEGLLRFFRRSFAALKPGGRFIFEPQPMKSYRKRKHASETTKLHYEAMKIKPIDFPKTLIETIGFQDCTLLGTPDAPGLSKGFKRPIYCARKPPLAGREPASAVLPLGPPCKKNKLNHD